MRTKEILQNLPNTILHLINALETTTQIENKICAEYVLTDNEIEQKALAWLDKFNITYAVEINDQEQDLLYLLKEYCLIAKNNERVIAKILQKIIELSYSIKHLQDKTQQCNQVTAKLKQSYYAKHGRMWSSKHGSWDEFQPKIDKNTHDIKIYTSEIESLEQMIDSGIKNIIIYDDFPLINTQFVKFFDLDLDLAVVSQISIICTAVAEHVFNRERKKISAEIAALIDEDIINSPTLLNLIDKSVNIRLALHNIECKLKNLQTHPSANAQVIEMESILLQQYQEQMANIKIEVDFEVLKARISKKYVTEFKASIGYQLIQEDEWQKVLAYFIEQELKIASGFGTSFEFENNITLEKTKLAETIITRMPFQPEYYSNLGNWEKDENGRERYVSTCADKVLEERFSANIAQIYGYSEFMASSTQSNVKYNDWLLLNVGMAKRFAMYNSTSVFKDLIAADKEHFFVNEILQLQDEKLIKANKTNFNKAVDLLIEEINLANAEKLAKKRSLLAQYDQNLQALILKLHFSKWTTRLMLADSSYQLAHPDLNQPTEFKVAAEQLKTVLRKNINDLDLAYTINANYCKHGALLGLWRFSAFSKLSAIEILAKFKNKVQHFYANEQNVFNILQTTKNDIKTLEHEAQRLTDRAMELNRKLLDLKTKESADKTLLEKQKHKKEVDLIQFEIDEIYKDKTKCIIETKQFFKMELNTERSLRQLHAKLELEKEQALNLDLFETKQFLAAKTDNLQDFAQQMKDLATSTNKADINKLFAFAIEIIDILPAIDLPDVCDVYGLSYSEDSINERAKAFVVLSQAKKAAINGILQEPENFYLLALKDNFDQALAVFYNKFIVDSQNTAMLGFDLLSQQRKAYYLAKKAELNTNTYLETSAIKQLNDDLLIEIDLIKYKRTKVLFDKYLLTLGEIGKKIMQPECLNLYIGLVNYQVVLYDLKLILENAYIHMDNNFLTEELRVEKNQQIALLEKDVSVMQSVLENDILNLNDLSYIKDNQNKYIHLLMQGAQHYLTTIVYSIDNTIVSYKLGKARNDVCDILRSILETEKLATNGLPTNLVGMVGAALIGLDPIELSAKYSDANIAKILSKEDFIKLKQTDSVFMLKSNILEEKLKLQAAAICTDIENFKKVHEPTFIAFAKIHKLGLQLVIVLSAIFIAIGSAILNDTLDIFNHTIFVLGVAIIAVCNGVLYVNFKAKNFPLEKLYAYALASIQETSHDLHINLEQLDFIKRNLNLAALISMLNTYFQEQTKRIQDRIVSYNLKSVTTRAHELLFAEKLLREIHCFHDMLQLKKEVEELLLEINLIKISNPAGAQNIQQQLKAILSEYLEINYTSYQKPHMVDTLVDSYPNASVPQEKTNYFLIKKLTSILNFSKSSYKNFQAHCASNNNQEKVAYELGVEQKQIAEMQKIKELLQSII